MKKLILLMLLIAPILSPLFSQNPLLDFWKAEKIKLTPEQVEQIRNGTFKPEDSKKGEEFDKLLSDGDNTGITSGNDPESEITAAINPVDSNNMVVSAIRLNGSIFNCPIYYTTDFGENWRLSSFNFAPSLSGTPMGGGDPVLCYGPDGTLYYSWIMIFEKSENDSAIAEIRWAYSINGGASWKYGDDSFVGRFAGKITQSGFNFTNFFDKQWMVCDNSNSVNRGNLYMSLTNLATGVGNAGDYAATGIYVGIKKAGENKFNRKLLKITPGAFTNVQFSSIDCDSQGRVYVSFWAYQSGSHSLWCIHSDNAFKTFSQPVKITSFKFNSNSQLYPDNGYRTVPGISSSRAYPYPQLKIDKSGGKYDGYIYVTWCGVGIKTILNNALDVYYSRSTDRGGSWSEPQTLNFDQLTSNTNQFYPTLDVNANGVVAVTYYDNKNTSGHQNTDYTSSISFDGGARFINRSILSNEETNFMTVGLVNSSFGIGEYNGLVMTKDYIIPFWCDGRGDNGRLKIYTTHYPISQVPVIKGYENQISPINGAISDLNVFTDNGVLHINFNSENVLSTTYKIYDLKGKLVSSNEFETVKGSNDFNFPLNTVSDGAYFIKFNFGGENHVAKFMATGM